MLINLQNYFGPEIIYLWLSFGVLPLWLTLIFFPNSRFSVIFISSIFLPIIFSLTHPKFPPFKAVSEILKFIATFSKPSILILFIIFLIKDCEVAK